eukprot:TRINITY_DN1021_c1_g1_i13.p1 TRINITY_DN1021_c1_g1~~TRINITY_DN1021_c1_g1_i13.p1  ORF type:complete len:152 (+),score=29.99 TRINITY_DN1021_c1_g1_i13:42-497(+)
MQAIVGSSSTSHTCSHTPLGTAAAALAMLYSFSAIASLCDEFFVPALSIFCQRMKMPFDFAGAILMAGGACAPDLFSAIVGVIILHTDVGVGTLVGSLLFNHLCVLGATSVAMGGIILEWNSVLRETAFYIASIVALLVVLADSLFCFVSF